MTEAEIIAALFNQSIAIEDNRAEREAFSAIALANPTWSCIPSRLKAAARADAARHGDDATKADLVEAGYAPRVADHLLRDLGRGGATA